MLTRQVSLVRTQYRAPVALFAKRLRQFRQRRWALLPTGKENSRRFASQVACGHYLQALLTKSEIELKLSQCKIQ